MTNAEKRDRIRQSLAEHPEWSNRRHAETLNLSAQTVGAVRAQLSAKSERPEPELVREANGRLVALVDLIVERPVVPGFRIEHLVRAGFEIPPELRDLPRRAAQDQGELVDLHGAQARRQRAAEEAH